MNKLKTLNDMETKYITGDGVHQLTIPVVNREAIILDGNELRQVAREWINDYQQRIVGLQKGSPPDFILIACYNLHINWIKHFFNLEDME